MEPMDPMNLEVRRIFNAKEARRRRLAELPMPEKVKRVVRLQKIAAPILRRRGQEMRPWKLPE
jgi:hypothetical protein